jgi:hypothetical protein
VWPTHWLINYYSGSLESESETATPNTLRYPEAVAYCYPRHLLFLCRLCLPARYFHRVCSFCVLILTTPKLHVQLEYQLYISTRGTTVVELLLNLLHNFPAYVSNIYRIKIKIPVPLPNRLDVYHSRINVSTGTLKRSITYSPTHSHASHFLVQGYSHKILDVNQEIPDCCGPPGLIIDVARHWSKTIYGCTKSQPSLNKALC